MIHKYGLCYSKYEHISLLCILSFFIRFVFRHLGHCTPKLTRWLTTMYLPPGDRVLFELSVYFDFCCLRRQKNHCLPGGR